jgi:hypothetical protein
MSEGTVNCQELIFWQVLLFQLPFGRLVRTNMQ